MSSFLASEQAHHTLIQWFATAGRPFPWREPSVDGWGVLVSEIMSQQTPMSRVQPVWEQWLQQWPSPAALAKASGAEVLRAWGKLGYPRRALRLHECAQVIAEQWDNRVPEEVEDLLSLPGVGSYTARAVACFAYGHNVPVVDTNVRRVVARIERGWPDQGKPREKADLAEVEALLPADPQVGTVWSAALMELGAIVCTARKPDCESCPLAEGCAWRAAGYPVWDTTTHGSRPKPQRFTGTDRQVRGLLMDVVRETSGGVPQSALDVVWPDAEQRQRAQQSLLDDGLLVQLGPQRFGLPGES